MRIRAYFTYHLNESIMEIYTKYLGYIPSNVEIARGISTLEETIKI